MDFKYTLEMLTSMPPRDCRQLDCAIYEQEGQYFACSIFGINPRMGRHREKPHFIIRGSVQKGAPILLERALRLYNLRDKKTLEGFKSFFIAKFYRFSHVSLRNSYEEDIKQCIEDLSTNLANPNFQ